MVTLFVMGVCVFTLMQIREGATNNYHEARNVNWARMLARQLLSELEFHKVEPTSGGFDGYPEFFYEIETTEVDLVTGKGDEDRNRAREKQDRKDKIKPKNEKSGFTPSDAQNDSEDEEEEHVYPVRRVKLTLRYPDFRRNAKEPRTLVVESIFPALPEDLQEDAKKKNSSAAGSPFGK